MLNEAPFFAPASVKTIPPKLMLKSRIILFQAFYWMPSLFDPVVGLTVPRSRTHEAISLQLVRHALLPKHPRHHPRVNILDMQRAGPAR